MIKAIIPAAVLLASGSALAGTTVLTVPSEYPTIAAAVAKANTDTNAANEYVIEVAPGTYTNDTATVTRAMTIEAQVPGSQVILNATAPLPNEKGILLALASLTVDGLTFENAAIANSLGGNGAGIRDQDTNPNDFLVVRNSAFSNNQMGILTSNTATFNIYLFDNVFLNNGNPNASFFGHAAYLGPGNMLIAIGNEACGTRIGHDIKSRMAVNIIENNTLYDGALDPNQPTCAAGSTSYALDIPNGGQAIVTGNTMIQGSSTQNNTMFAYGEEGYNYLLNSITFSNNMMQSSISGIAIYDRPSSPTPVEGSGNAISDNLTPVDPASANHLTDAGGGGTVSPDGSTSNAPSGAALVTAAGTWTWGAAASGISSAGQYLIKLNGASAAGGYGAEMEVNQGAHLYVLNSDTNTWYLWNNGGWAISNAP